MTDAAAAPSATAEAAVRPEPRVATEEVVVLDYGGQYSQLIARRVRELGVFSELLPHHVGATAGAERRPKGLILSGGPASVYADGAPRLEPALLELGIPVLGICYGMQLMTDMLGGEVAPAPQREYGHALITVEEGAPLLSSLGSELRVWASHGDFVTAAPAGFSVVATSANAPAIAAPAVMPWP